MPVIKILENLEGVQVHVLHPLMGHHQEELNSYLIYIYNTCTFVLHVVDRQEFLEEVKHRKWQEAMDAELLLIQSNNSWELIELPSGKKAVGLKWVCKTKYRAY